MADNPRISTFRMFQIALGLMVPCGIAGDATGADLPYSATGEPAASAKAPHDPGSVGWAQTSSHCSTAPTTYASHVKAQVSWPGNIALEGGRGTLHIWMKATLSFEGNTISGTAVPCGNEIPDIKTTFVGGSKKLGTTVPPKV